jgi:hypothetical protein
MSENASENLIPKIVEYLHGLLKRGYEIDDGYIPSPFEGLPEEILIASTFDEFVFSEIVRVWDYRNPLPEEIRKKISTAPESVRVRYALSSQHESPPPDVWDLVDDSLPVVRVALVGSQTPPCVLTRLACDSDSSVRASVARYSYLLPREQIEALALDSSSAVRVEVAYYCRVEDVIFKLLEDPEDSVRQHAVSGILNVEKVNLSRISKAFDNLVNDKCEITRGNIARSKETSPEALRLLASDPVQSVRVGVASNKSTPFDILEILAKSEDPFVSLRAQMNLGIIPEGAIGNQGRQGIYEREKS